MDIHTNGLILLDSHRTTYTDACQASYRMRQISHGQTAYFLYEKTNNIERVLDILDKNEKAQNFAKIQLNNLQSAKAHYRQKYKDIKDDVHVENVPYQVLPISFPWSDQDREYIEISKSYISYMNNNITLIKSLQG